MNAAPLLFALLVAAAAGGIGWLLLALTDRWKANTGQRGAAPGVAEDGHVAHKVGDLNLAETLRLVFRVSTEYGLEAILAGLLDHYRVRGRIDLSLLGYTSTVSVQVLCQQPVW
jgi:hypothetical protein